ncbi:hypothetical protein R3W88_008607 [Solanum pinnatisectum]|uniref:Uncharacterized protein n=1 Tax=Solanum pinnatisectum TaxID=50273 RepID=A0AAV9M8V3_9SOLN|nr:hypothetical protein R3W88_008607 [Solanum pinnatisectum]
MEIPQITFKVWTDDFIIPNPLFLIEIRIQEFVQYLLTMIRDNDDSLCEILSSIGVPLHRMLPIITESSEARNRATSAKCFTITVMNLQTSLWTMLRKPNV